MSLSEDVIVSSRVSSTLPHQNTSDSPKDPTMSQLCEHSTAQTEINDVCARTSNLTIKSLETDSVPVVNNTNAKTVLKRSHSFTSSSLVGHRASKVMIHIEYKLMCLLLSVSRRFEIEEEEMDLARRKPVLTSFTSTEYKLAHSIKKDVSRSSLLNCPVKPELHTSSEKCVPSEKVRNDSLSLKEFRNETRADQVTAKISMCNPNEGTTVKRKQTTNMCKATTCKQMSTQVPRILHKHAHGETVAHYLMKQKYPQTKKTNPIFKTRITKRPLVSNSKT